MDAFRFILENPHPNAATNRQRKRARLVTACDSCRIKKIKCQQSSPNARCEACKSAKIPCLFGDRDRYQAERGVSCAWSPSPPLPQHHQQHQQQQQQHDDDDAPASPASSSSSSSRKRKVEDSGLSQDSLHPRLSPSLLPLPSHNHNPNHHHHHHPHIPLFDPSRPRFPHPLRMHNLALLFFDSIGPHFPFLDRADILHRIAHSTCSAILANAIAGLAARFSPDPLPASPFYAMATSLAAHVASAPSIEALHALLCITWAEHIPSPPPSPPSNNAWSYSRHAIAMALDLGLGNEATIRVAASPAVRARLRLTWWSVVCLADIAPALATGSQPVLDLNLFDTALPTVADDVSLMRRTTIDAALLRSRIARAHSGTSSEIATLSARLTPALTFSKQALLHWSSLGLGAAFVSMHFALHALCTLAHRQSPSSSSSPDATHPAARTAAKAIVDIFVVVQESGAHAALRDPFLAEALHVALHVFQAESGGSAVARQWSDTFARKCQDGIARVARACAGSVTHHSYPAPPQDAYPALPQDALEYKSASSSSLDLFTVPQNASWLLRPGLVDDSASDTSSSFRSSSHELSPQLNTTLGASPLVRTADAEFHFEGGVFDAASASASEMIDGVDFAGMGMGMGAFFDQSCAGPFAYEGLAADGYAKDANSRAGASAAVFPPVQWLARA